MRRHLDVVVESMSRLSNGRDGRILSHQSVGWNGGEPKYCRKVLERLTDRGSLCIDR